MNDFIGGTSATVVIPLMRGDVPVIPTVGTVTYTLFDHSGQPVVGHTDVPVVTDALTHTLTIITPSEVNAISGDKRFERRTLVVSYLAGGAAHRVTKSYRLVPFLNHAVTPQSVREFLGVAASELSDDSLDISAAYFQVEADVLPVSLADVLSTGTIKELAANEAIRMRVVIDVLPSIRQRVAQSQSDGVFEFRRPDLSKFDRVERQAWERYSMARDIAAGTDSVSNVFVLTTTDADPFTGE